MYYTVIRHDGNLRTLEKCRNVNISVVFSNARCVLSQCNTRLGLLHLLYDIGKKTIKHVFFVLYSDKKKHGFLPNRSAQGPIYI